MLVAHRSPSAVITILLAVAPLAACPQAAHAATVTVLGTSNIFGAGHSPPNDTPAPSGGGGAPPRRPST